MVLFFCPWPRRARPISPSDVARSYQGVHLSATQVEQCGRHDNLTTVEDVPPPTEKQLESLSRRLRRRFSREAKHAYVHHEHGKPVFPFSFKHSKKPSTSASKPEVTMLEDVGSSLMSERGYDSDAQFITTPKRVVGSGVTRGIRRIGLSDLIERSQEREESELWESCRDEGNTEPQEAAFGFRFIPTPNGSLRYIRGYWQAMRERNGSRVLLEHASDQRDDDHRISPARSLPNLNYTGRGFDLPFPDRSQIFETSGDSDNPGASSDWGQMRRLQQKHGMVSSGSLPNLSIDLVIPKTRQATNSGTSHGEPKSLYLGHMGTSHQLGSQGVSSDAMSDGPATADFVRKKRHGGFMPVSLESFQKSQASGTSAFPGFEVQVRKSRQQDASSCYSRETNFPHSTNISPRLQSPTPNSPVVSDVEKLEYGPGAAEMTVGLNHTANEFPSSIALPRSKFREHCDIGSAELGQTDTGEMVQPRKVSIGWMSGGRRVGYGYTPVPDAEGIPKSQSMDDLEHPHQKEHGCHEHDNEMNMNGQVSKDSTHQVPHPVSVIKQSQHRNFAPTLRSQDSAQTVESDTMPPSLQAIFGGQPDRSSRYDETGAIWIDEGIAGDFDTPDISSLLPVELPETYDGTFTRVLSAKRWAKISQSANVQVQAHSKGESPQGLRKSSHGEIVDAAADTPNHSDAKSVNESEGRAHQSHRTHSLMGKWPIFSKRRESRRHSHVHQAEPSDASSAVYLDCDANSLNRANSTKSVGTLDLTAKYRERMQMPGSFDGSRWANRSSRMLRELCTTDD